MIGDQAVQRTTVDPSTSYGGRIVLQKPKKPSQDVKLTIDWNGEQYQFAYHLPKKGEPMPVALRSSTGPDRLARNAAAAAAIPAVAPAVRPGKPAVPKCS